MLVFQHMHKLCYEKLHDWCGLVWVYACSPFYKKEPALTIPWVSSSFLASFLHTSIYSQTVGTIFRPCANWKNGRKQGRKRGRRAREGGKEAGEQGREECRTQNKTQIKQRNRIATSYVEVFLTLDQMLNSLLQDYCIKGEGNSKSQNFLHFSCTNLAEGIPTFGPVWTDSQHTFQPSHIWHECIYVINSLSMTTPKISPEQQSNKLAVVLVTIETTIVEWLIL